MNFSLWKHNNKKFWPLQADNWLQDWANDKAVMKQGVNVDLKISNKPVKNT